MEILRIKVESDDRYSHNTTWENNPYGKLCQTIDQEEKKFESLVSHLNHSKHRRKTRDKFLDPLHIACRRDLYKNSFPVWLSTPETVAIVLLYKNEYLASIFVDMDEYETYAVGINTAYNILFLRASEPKFPRNVAEIILDEVKSIAKKSIFIYPLRPMVPILKRLGWKYEKRPDERKDFICDGSRYRWIE